MNRKGFTLVELLAVIIILTLLAILTSTIVTNLVKDSKQKLSDTQIELIKSAARAWGSDNLNKISSIEGCGYLTLQDLKEYGVINSNIFDPNTDKKLSNELKIKITTTKSNGNLLTNYEVTEDVNGCKEIYGTICTAVSTATLGNVPTGNYLPGDEYTCEVKPGTSHTFFVLNSDKDKVNLIMNNNICEDGTLATNSNKCYVPWISKLDYERANLDNTACSHDACNDEGPITATNYLNNATSDWTNIENLNEIYNDAYTNFVLKGKARMLKLHEILDLGCVEYKVCYSWIGSEYWLLNANKTDSLFSYFMSGNIFVNGGIFVYQSNVYGVRPVITVSKYRFKN